MSSKSSAVKAETPSQERAEIIAGYLADDASYKASGQTPAQAKAYAKEQSFPFEQRHQHFSASEWTAFMEIQGRVTVALMSSDDPATDPDVQALFEEKEKFLKALPKNKPTA